MCKMTEINKRRDDDLEQSSSSASALRNASSYWKHIKQQQQQNSDQVGSAGCCTRSTLSGTYSITGLNVTVGADVALSITGEGAVTLTTVAGVTCSITGTDFCIGDATYRSLELVLDGKQQVQVPRIRSQE